MDNKFKNTIRGSLGEIAAIQWQFRGPGPFFLKMSWFHMWHEQFGWSYEDMQKCVEELRDEGAVRILNKIDENTENEMRMIEILHKFESV